MVLDTHEQAGSGLFCSALLKVNILFDLFVFVALATSYQKTRFCFARAIYIAKLETTIDGCGFMTDEVIAGDCYGLEPMVVARIKRTTDYTGLYYPGSYNEFLEDGMAFRRIVVNIGCNNYQRLIAIGAPVVACSCRVCPNKITLDQQT